MPMLTIALVALILSDSQSPTAAVTTKPATDEPIIRRPADFSYLPRTAAITVNGKPWFFQPGPDGRGVRLRVSCADNAESINLGLDDVVHDVIGIAASSREYQKFDRGVYIGLVLESGSPRGEKREYRMAFGEYYPLEAASAGKHRWIASGVLATRPAKDPFNAFGVSLIGGDSLMVTIQKLSRGPTPGNIETHVFVNHCPSGINGRMRDEITEHYAPEPNVMQVLPKPK